MVDFYSLFVLVFGRQLIAFAQNTASPFFLTRREDVVERVVRLLHVLDQLHSGLFSSCLQVR